jgi:hypothetical protein
VHSGEAQVAVRSATRLTLRLTEPGRQRSTANAAARDGDHRNERGEHGDDAVAEYDKKNGHCRSPPILPERIRRANTDVLQGSDMARV